MNIKIKNIPVRFIVTVAILLILITFIMVAQCSLGRYTSSFGGSVNFSPKAKGSLNLNCGEWSAESGVQTQSLSVTKNASNDSNRIRIRLYAPYTNVALPALRLEQNGVEYTASATEIPEGTTVYRSYGAGQIYCFAGADGQELEFELPESAAGAFNATLILTDEKTDTAGFRLIVEAVNNEK